MRIRPSLLRIAASQKTAFLGATSSESTLVRMRAAVQLMSSAVLDTIVPSELEFDYNDLRFLSAKIDVLSRKMLDVQLRPEAANLYRRLDALLHQ